MKSPTRGLLAMILLTVGLIATVLQAQAPTPPLFTPSSAEVDQCVRRRLGEIAELTQHATTTAELQVYAQELAGQKDHGLPPIIERNCRRAVSSAYRVDALLVALHTWADGPRRPGTMFVAPFPVSASCATGLTRISQRDVLITTNKILRAGLLGRSGC